MPVDTPVDTPVAAVADRLLDWYDRHARTLPWRTPPGDATPPDPYRVWLSEVMLQQTTVAAAAPYFHRFTTRWPDVAALAAADEAELMAAWAGLGYYARARNLIACARAVVADHGGAFPDTEQGLRALPGIGAYTAAAIAAIAFGRRAVVLDANVERVVSRLFAVAEPLPSSRPRLRTLADTIVPGARAGDFAQAMMDLGSAICTSRRPRCLACPLADGCRAREQGDPDHYPVKAAKKPKPRRHGTAWFLRRGSDVLLVRRPAKGLLGGMRALPGGAWDGTPELPLAREWRAAGSVAHVFTHFALALDVRVADVRDPPVAGEWWPLDRLADAGLPTLYARAAALGVAALEEETLTR